MAENLVEAHPGKFSNDFENNKKVLVEMGLFEDKGVRNKIAGYIQNLVKGNN